jgi:RNA polymerase sigma-54 factor
MENGRTEIRLEPSVGLRTLPLPLLFARLSLLSLPSADLVSALEERTANNPLLSVEPPGPADLRRQDPRTGDEEDPWETAEALPDLDEAVRSQLYLIPEVALLGRGAEEKLSACLDARGYLAASENELAAAFKTDTATFERVLESVRAAVEPPGLFARDLPHCLKLQLSRQGLLGSDAWTLLEEGLEELSNQDLAALRKKLAWERERLEAALRTLRRLDPHPGFGFSHPGTILPEVEIRYGESGKPALRLLRENLPRILLDAELYHAAKDRARGPFREARELLCALAARCRTKLRLALLLSEEQQAYLRGLSAAPAPLTLARAGRKLSLSPSTVQRAAACTWAVTPRGTLPLSSLLTRGAAARPDLSVQALRDVIRAGWKSGKSDAALARELGLPPRTVTWHRHRLGLPAVRRA